VTVSRQSMNALQIGFSISSHPTVVSTSNLVRHRPTSRGRATDVSFTGQAIASNAAVLPPAMQAKFAKLFDDAAQVPLSEVLKVFESQFHRPPSGPGGVFEYFDPVAVASASIAQVHKAKLREEDGGGWVAVKVQKPAVGKQVNLDLAMFRSVMWVYEKIFDVKAYFVVGE